MKSNPTPMNSNSTIFHTNWKATGDKLSSRELPPKVCDNDTTRTRSIVRSRLYLLRPGALSSQPRVRIRCCKQVPYARWRLLVWQPSPHRLPSRWRREEHGGIRTQPPVRRRRRGRRSAPSHTRRQFGLRGGSVSIGGTTLP